VSDDARRARRCDADVMMALLLDEPPSA